MRFVSTATSKKAYPSFPSTPLLLWQGDAGGKGKERVHRGEMVSSLFTLSPTAGIRPAHSRANAFAFGSLRMRINFGGPVDSCLLGASATLLSHSLQERERGVKEPKEKIVREIDGF